VHRSLIIVLALAASPALASEYTSRVTDVTIRSVSDASHKALVKTNTTSDTHVSEVEVSFVDPESDEVLASGVSTSGASITRMSDNVDLPETLGEILTVGFSMEGSAGDTTFSLDTGDLVLFGERPRTWRGADEESGADVSVFVKRDEALEVIVLDIDVRNRSGGTSSLTVTPTLNREAMAEVELSAASMDQLFVLDMGDLSSLDGQDVYVKTTAQNAAGMSYDNVDLPETLGEILTVEFTEMGAEDGGDGIQGAILQETAAGELILVTVAATDGGGGDLEVSVVDDASGERALAGDGEPSQIERQFVAERQLFDDGDFATDYPYLVLVDLLSDGGEPIGEQVELELRPVAGLADIALETAREVDLGESDGSVGGAIWMDEDGMGYLFVAVNGQGAAAIQSVELSFEEPFEGPAPMESNPELDLVREWRQWEHSGEALTEGGLLEATLSLTDGGEQVDYLQTHGTAGALTGERTKSGGHPWLSLSGIMHLTDGD